MPPLPSLNRKLNLVIPVDGTARGTIHVHTSPLELPIFELYFELISVAYGRMMQQLGPSSIMSGPRVAKLYLGKAADQLGMRDELNNGLLPAIEQATNVLAIEEGKGWVTFPYYNAKQWLSDEDRSQVENAVAFFIISSASLPPQTLPSSLGLMQSLWGAQTTSSNCTAFGASLTTSTQPEATERTEGSSATS